MPGADPSLRAFVDLVGAVVWPAAILLLAFLFRKEIASILRNLERLTVKYPGGELTAEAKTRFAVSLAAASAARAEAQATEGKGAVRLRDISRSVESIAWSSREGLLRGARILWVDDVPLNNRYEIRAIEALGMDVATSKGTEDALERALVRDYDVVISDMARPPDSQAGYTLLRALREDGIGVPYIIYAGNRAPEYRERALELGALGCTNDPEELIRLVAAAVADARAVR